MRRKVQILPNAITAFGLACGLFVIFHVNTMDHATTTYYTIRASAILLLIAAAADVLDGAIARITKTESHFGMLFDSISDSITFGIAPSIVLLHTIPWDQHAHLEFFATTAAMVYTICGVLRLVRYSIDSLYTHNNAPSLAPKELSLAKKYFTGLPIPAAASAIISLILFIHSPEGAFFIDPTRDTHLILSLTAMILLGYLMVSRWRFFSLKTLRFKVTSFHLVLFTAIGAVLILYGIYQHFALVFFALSWLYIILAFFSAILRIITGKKTFPSDDTAE